MSLYGSRKASLAEKHLSSLPPSPSVFSFLSHLWKGVAEESQQHFTKPGDPTKQECSFFWPNCLFFLLPDEQSGHYVQEDWKQGNKCEIKEVFFFSFFFLFPMQVHSTATAAQDVNTVLFSMETTYTSCLNWLILSKRKMFI